MTISVLFYQRSVWSEENWKGLCLGEKFKRFLEQKCLVMNDLKDIWNSGFRIWDLVKISWCPCLCCPVGTKLVGPSFSLIPLHVHFLRLCGSHGLISVWLSDGPALNLPEMISLRLCFLLYCLCQIFCMQGGAAEFFKQLLPKVTSKTSMF